jgi:hypothetical protein
LFQRGSMRCGYPKGVSDLSPGVAAPPLPRVKNTKCKCYPEGVVDPRLTAGRFDGLTAGRFDALTAGGIVASANARGGGNNPDGIKGILCHLNWGRPFGPTPA